LGSNDLKIKNVPSIAIPTFSPGTTMGVVLP
jgi:hypothetical protein